MPAGGRLSSPKARGLRQPISLFYLTATEAFGAFALYGTLSLLVLYLTSDLLAEGAADAVLGLAWFKANLTAISGAQGSIAIASQIFGIFAALICFTPVLGGFVADRLLSQSATVTLGALLQVVGYSALILKETFLLALLLLVIGSGLVTTNLKAQIGALYDADDPRRSRGFGVSLIAVNMGAFAAPLVCGTIGEKLGWHLGFAAAAAGMGIGLAVYLLGLKHLRSGVQTNLEEITEEPSKSGGFYLTLGVIGLNIFYFGTYNQTFNIFALWARDAVNRQVLGFEVPVTWLLSLDALCAVSAMIILMRRWKVQSLKNREAPDGTKLITGFALLTGAFVALFLASTFPQQTGVPLMATLPFFALTGAASAFIFTSSLAIISRNAPEKVKATMIGLYAVSAFAGNLLVGFLGRYYEPFGPGNFWLLNAALAVAGLIIALMLRISVDRSLAASQLHPSSSEDKAAYGRDRV